MKHQVDDFTGGLTFWNNLIETLCEINSDLLEDGGDGLGDFVLLPRDAHLRGGVNLNPCSFTGVGRSLITAVNEFHWDRIAVYWSKFDFVLLSPGRVVSSGWG